MLRNCLTALGATLVLTIFVVPMSAANAQVVGAGSTLSRGLMADWSAQYGPSVGGVTYSAIGSSAGVKSIREGSVDFGVTEIPLTSAALRQTQLKQLPLAATAVAVFVNLPELANKSIRLTGDILAEIYKGNITEWNHSQIKALNRDVTLPATAITPVWRTDGSGQSMAFTTYLSRQSAGWRRSPGAEQRLALPVGVGVSGGAAVIAGVKAKVGAIGYDSIGAARAAGGLTIAALLNSSGNYVPPSEASIREALDNAVWSEDTSTGDLDGSAGKTAYPISTLTYALVPQVPGKGRPSAASFLNTAVAQGDAAAVKNGFVVLPPTAKAMVAKATKP